MKRKIKYLCDWCGCSFDNEEMMVHHKQICHNDFNAAGEIKKLNKEMMNKEKIGFKIKEQAKLKPISTSEVKRMINANLSDLTCIEILMKLDQGDQWREEFKLLDLAKKTGVMCRKDVETTEGKRITYDWEYFKENEKAMIEELNGIEKNDSVIKNNINKGNEDKALIVKMDKLKKRENKNDSLGRNNISKRNVRDIRRKRAKSKKRVKKTRCSSIANNQ